MDFDFPMFDRLGTVRRAVMGGRRKPFARNARIDTSCTEYRVLRMSVEPLSSLSLDAMQCNANDLDGPVARSKSTARYKRVRMATAF